MKAGLLRLVGIKSQRGLSEKASAVRVFGTEYPKAARIAAQDRAPVIVRRYDERVRDRIFLKVIYAVMPNVLLRVFVAGDHEAAVRRNTGVIPLTFTVQ